MHYFVFSVSIISIAYLIFTLQFFFLGMLILMGIWVRAWGILDVDIEKFKDAPGLLPAILNSPSKILFFQVFSLLIYALSIINGYILYGISGILILIAGSFSISNTIHYILSTTFRVRWMIIEDNFPIS